MPEGKAGYKSSLPNEPKNGGGKRRSGQTPQQGAPGMHDVKNVGSPPGRKGPKSSTHGRDKSIGRR